MIEVDGHIPGVMEFDHFARRLMIINGIDAAAIGAVFIDKLWEKIKDLLGEWENEFNIELNLIDEFNAEISVELSDDAQWLSQVYSDEMNEIFGQPWEE